MFPILDSAMLDEFRAGATSGELEELENWFGVSAIHRSPRRSPLSGDGSPRHIVSATVFWKHVGAKDPDLPTPTRQRLVHARRMGLIKRFDPWESYIQPILTHGRRQAANHQQIEFRIYLASDLDFLLDDFLDAGWDVHLMKSPSIRYCPGGFWRFLALEEDALVTIIDADRADVCHGEIERTRLMDRMGLGLWRVPGYYNQEPTKEVRYRPILGGHFGAKGGLPAQELIRAYVWHVRRGSLPLTVEIPGIGQRPLMFPEWPGYGYDEIFQLVALYPWLVGGGTLTFVPTDARSLFLPADIEYATQANPRSELVYV